MKRKRNLKIVDGRSKKTKGRIAVRRALSDGRAITSYERGRIDKPKVLVDGMTADEIIYAAIFVVWPEPLCKDVTCKCTNSVRWRAARAIDAVREFERCQKRLISGKQREL